MSIKKRHVSLLYAAVALSSDTHLFIGVVCLVHIIGNFWLIIAKQAACADSSIADK